MLDKQTQNAMDTIDQIGREWDLDAAHEVHLICLYPPKDLEDAITLEDHSAIFHVATDWDVDEQGQTFITYDARLTYFMLGGLQIPRANAVLMFSEQIIADEERRLSEMMAGF